MPRQPICALIFCLFCPLIFSQAASKPNQLDYFRQTIFLTAVANGAFSMEIVLMLDTGATTSSLDEHTINSIGLECKGSYTDSSHTSVTHGEMCTVPNLSIQGRTVTNLAVKKVSDYSLAETVYKRPVAGILGMDFLSGSIMSVDFCKNTIEFTDVVPKRKLKNVFPLKMTLTLPEIPVRLPSGDTVNLLFDTGFDSHLDAALFKPAIPKIDLMPPLKRSTLADQGGRISATDGQIRYIKLSNTWEIAPAEIRLVDEVTKTFPSLHHAGLLGLYPFSDRLLIIDLKNNRLLTRSTPSCKR